MRNRFLVLMFCFFLQACAAAQPAVTPILRGTGDLGIIIERTTGQIQIIDSSAKKSIAQVAGLGDLSHASAVFSRDARYVFVFGRDGGLTKIDLLRAKIEKRILQSGNSIGGAISQDGRFVAVSNYTPGGVKIFDSHTLDLVADIPAVGASGRQSKVVGLIDLPGNRFVFSLYAEGEIWLAAPNITGSWELQKFTGIGKLPYDAAISGDGRYYIAGLFGEDGLALLDTWNTNEGIRRVLNEFGPGDQKLPVYKMPHLEGWGAAGRFSFLPAVGRHEVLVVDQETWMQVGRIPVLGQPIFCIAAPGNRQVWVNFALPDNSKIQVVDVTKRSVVKTLEPGKAILHMEFTPRGEHVWMSARDDNKVVIFDANTLQQIGEIPAQAPSGIFFTHRAHRIGL